MKEMDELVKKYFLTLTDEELLEAFPDQCSSLEYALDRVAGIEERHGGAPLLAWDSMNDEPCAEAARTWLGNDYLEGNTPDVYLHVMHLMLHEMIRNKIARGAEQTSHGLSLPFTEVEDKSGHGAFLDGGSKVKAPWRRK